MAAQIKRNPLKLPKDRQQGIALLNPVAEAMPHYPLDLAFEAELPGELVPHYTKWREQSDESASADW